MRSKQEVGEAQKGWCRKVSAMLTEGPSNTSTARHWSQLLGLVFPSLPTCLFYTIQASMSKCLRLGCLFVTHSFGACKVQDQDASRLGFWWEPVSQTQSLLSVSSACWKGQTSSLGICFKKDFYLGGNEGGRERENRKSFQHLFYFPNASNGPWLELGAVNSIQVSHVSAAAQSLKASLLPPRTCRSRKLELVAGGGHWARELGYRLNVWPSVFTTRWNSNSMYEIRTFMS